MPVTTDFSGHEGPITVRLRRAAALHIEAAVMHADQQLKPHQNNSAWSDPIDHAASFHQHAQAASTLREVAALLEETSKSPL